jgi:2-methylcitrate dehydratase PrpD
MQTTQKLAEFAASLEHEDIPSSIVDKAKEIILDTIGVGLGGADAHSSRILLDVVSQFGGVKESTIFGHPDRASCRDAALINGAMAHALELEEAQTLPGHPAVVVLPAALAIAERQHLSGRELIAAFVAGYDIHCRLAHGSKRSAMELGWHFTSVCGVFGAAVAVGRLLRLDRQRMANALGLAGSQAAGNLMSETDGTLAKRLQPGLAAQGGIISALLAEKGYTGPTNVLEAPHGFYDMYAHEYDLNTVADGLGEQFEIANSNLKIYPCCSFAHGSIDAALMLVANHGLKPSDVRRIEIKVTSPSYTQACQPLDKKRRPQNPVFAQFSIPFFVAMAICKGGIDFDPVDQDALKDPEILALSNLVYPENDPDLEDEYRRTGLLPTKVTVVTRSGRSFHQRVVFPKGHSQNPLSFEEVRQKFEHFASKVLSTNDVKDIVDIVYRLEELDDVADLCRKFTGHRSSHTPAGPAQR